MKMKWTLILGLIVLLLVASCGNNYVDEDTAYLDEYFEDDSGVASDELVYSCNSPLDAQCEAEKDDLGKNNCYADLAKDSLDECYCTYTTEKVTEIDCFKEIAILKQDVNLCEYSGIHAGTCKDQVAYRLGDSGYCDSDDCENRFLFLDEGKYSCNEKTTSSFQERFYMDAALITQDSCWCDSLDNSFFQGGCYHDLGILLMDESICDKAGGYLAKGCKNTIATLR